MVPTDPGGPADQAGFPQSVLSAPGRQAMGGQLADGGPPAPPSVSLPKGGGAIRDIGEKFTVSAATGTASLAIPVATSPGRAGFGPSLSLSYDSGAGNGPFGLGWKIVAPGHHPQDRQGAAPLPRRPGPRHVHPERRRGPGPGPRRNATALGAGARAADRGRPATTRSSGTGPGSRACSRGSNAGATWTPARRTGARSPAPMSPRSTAPPQPAASPTPTTRPRVFSWLICATYDDTGNAAVYDYVAEDSAGVDTGAAERAQPHRAVQVGEPVPQAHPLWQPGALAARQRHRPFSRMTTAAAGSSRSSSTTATTAEHAPRPEPDRAVAVRPRPVLHLPARLRGADLPPVPPGAHVPPLPGRARRRRGLPGVLHRPDLPSTGGSGMTTVASVTHTGYRRRDGGYHSASLPPLELRYSPDVIGTRGARPEPGDAGEPARRGGRHRLPVGGPGRGGPIGRPGPARWRLVLPAQPRRGPVRARRGCSPPSPPRPGAARGSNCSTWPATGTWTWPSSAARCRAATSGPTTAAGSRSARSGRCPNISWDDPDLRMVDLDGDGLADVLITGDDAFTWYPSLGLEGFGDGRRAFQPTRGARSRDRGLMLADPEQTIYLADMSGDGLSDLVRVRNGEVCYWPNTRLRPVRRQGDHGRAARGWTSPGHFDQRRVRLADVDGTGCADLIYLHPDGTRVYLNQSGNGYSEPHYAAAGVPAAGQPGPRHGGRPARPRHRVPGLVLAAARRRRAASCATST